MKAQADVTLTSLEGDITVCSTKVEQDLHFNQRAGRITQLIGASKAAAVRFSKGVIPRVRVSDGSQSSLLFEDVFGAILGKNVMIINLFT